MNIREADHINFNNFLTDMENIKFLKINGKHNKGVVKANQKKKYQLMVI
jgi:hypothetical protein